MYMYRQIAYIMYSLMLLFSLLQFTTCTVYTVTPDDHYYRNTTCHHCHNLQHYLLNVNKYFTSNTQLLFLPGTHYLDTDLIIQNVHNILLISSIANDTTEDTVIRCNSTLIEMINVSKLAIENIAISYHGYPSLLVRLFFIDCSFVNLHHLKLNDFAIVGINMMGNSYFTHVDCYTGIHLLYNSTYTSIKHHSLLVNNSRVHSVELIALQKLYTITIKIINVQWKNYYFSREPFFNAKDMRNTKVLLINCQFISNIYGNHIHFLNFNSTNNGNVQFINCQFIHNNIMIMDPRNRNKKTTLIRLHGSVDVEFSNCNFYGNSEEQILLQTRDHDTNMNPINIIIKNTSFIGMIGPKSQQLSLISLSYSALLVISSVSFQNITSFNSIVSIKGNSQVIIHGIVTFSHNYVHVLMDFYDNNRKYMIIKENIVLKIEHNEVWSLLDMNLPAARYPYPFCSFQYVTSLARTKVQMQDRNYLIRFYDNQCVENCYRNLSMTNCQWLKDSLFNNTDTIPIEVNSYYMQFINVSGIYKLSQIIEQSSLCVCATDLHHDCHINELGYLYPGQTLTVPLYHRRPVDADDAVVVKTDITQQYITPCIVLDISENAQRIDKQCAKLHYTIGFPTDSWCELFLKIALDTDSYLNIFYIRQTTCPIGFVKKEKRCQCDPVLVQHGITNCNINDQTMLRPANSWISVATNNSPDTYHISLQCPFHYCLPHSSHLTIDSHSTNTQCQFNRSGLLCGQCQHGFSAVFSSSSCQECSNIYVLLVIPIAIVGIILVSILFTLNLTVTDGTINGFIFYANIISINSPVFFTELNHFTPSYTFISLANLDLGIETCFYNGMDDYVKIWLQLAFPVYLILIATLIIITSRYSATIQRLTARRALPVLATLFLLSYTKILHTVSSILFSYSTITHLPSKHTTRVWSVDANVPLFGVIFPILFIVCLILFLILISFNSILLFTRTLSKFRFINKFKPLLDAYHGPYKNSFYYWTGLQLLMRAALFGISSLDRNVNLTVSIILFGVLGGIHGTIHPFKRKYKNHQELILILNLQGLYTILLYSQDSDNFIAVNIMVAMAAIQFGCIIAYHIIVYLHDGVIRRKMQAWLGRNALIKWIIKLLTNSTLDTDDDIYWLDYQEPLVDQN